MRARRPHWRGCVAIFRLRGKHPRRRIGRGFGVGDSRECPPDEALKEQRTIGGDPAGPGSKPWKTLIGRGNDVRELRSAEPVPIGEARVRVHPDARSSEPRDGPGNHWGACRSDWVLSMGFKVAAIRSMFENAMNIFCRVVTHRLVSETRARPAAR
jgi:hypothetical protein